MKTYIHYDKIGRQAILDVCFAKEREHQLGEHVQESS